MVMQLIQQIFILNILIKFCVYGGSFFQTIDQVPHEMQCSLKEKQNANTLIECLLRCDLEDSSGIFTKNNKCFCTKKVCTSPSIAVDFGNGMFYHNKRLESIKNEKIANSITLITTETTTTTVTDTTPTATPSTAPSQTTTKTTISPTTTSSITIPPQTTTTTTTTPSTTIATTTTLHTTTAMKTTPPAATSTTTLSTTIPPDQCIFKLSDKATMDVESSSSLINSAQECITKCYQEKGNDSFVAGVCYFESQKRCYCIRQTTNFVTALGHNICFFPTTA